MLDCFNDKTVKTSPPVEEGEDLELIDSVS